MSHQTIYAGAVEGLLPQSPKKRAKAVYAGLNYRSREDARQLVEILRREYIPDKRLVKLELEAKLRIAPVVAPWIMDDPKAEFMTYYCEHLYGRIHGVGIPAAVARAVVKLVHGYTIAEVERRREPLRGQHSQPDTPSTPI